MTESRRVFKKVFIAIVYLAIFFGLGTGIYFLARPKPAPPAAPAPQTSPIEVIWSQAFNAGPGLYSAAAKIRNPNTSFDVSNLNYTFSLYDSSGVLLTTVNGQSFIWPGESKYLISGGINLTKTPIKTDLQINEPVWQEKQNFGGIDLTLANVSYGAGKSGSGIFFSIDATAINNTPYDLNRAYVSAVIFDKNGLPIAVGSTVLENLKSKERRPVSVPWFSSFSGAPANVDLTISTNIWDIP